MNTKPHIIFAGLILQLLAATVLTTTAVAQWDWAIRSGGGYRDYNDPSWLTTDRSGNVILAGCFVNTPNGDIDGHSTSDALGRNFHALIMKYSPKGEQQWIKYFGHEPGVNAWGVQARGVAVDSNDNIYVVGTFSSTMTVDGQTVTASGGNGDMNYEIFLCKYEASGELAWIENFGSPHQDDFTFFFSVIHVTPSGKILILGKHGDDFEIDNKIISTDDGDFFVAEFTPDGHCVWINGYGTETNTAINIYHDPTCFDVDTAGNIYITALERQYIINPKDTIIEIPYLIKLDPNGVQQWSINKHVLPRVKTDTHGLINYGQFTHTIFEHEWRISAKGSSDIALARYSFDGTFIAREVFSGDQDEYITSLSTASNGNLMFGLISRGGMTLGTDYYPKPSYWFQSFFIECDDNGKLLRHSRSNDVRPFVTTVGKNNELFAAGQFDGTLQFGSKMLESLPDCSDLFLGEYTFATSSVAVPTQEQEIAFFPNPATAVVSWALPEELEYQPVFITITDLIGTTIHKTVTDQPQLDVSALPNGTYHCTLSTIDRSYTGKIVIIR